MKRVYTIYNSKRFPLQVTIRKDCTLHISGITYNQIKDFLLDYEKSN